MSDAERRQAQYRPEDYPEPLRWKGDGPPPARWWAYNEDGQLTLVYRSYKDYCDD